MRVGLYREVFRERYGRYPGHGVPVPAGRVHRRGTCRCCGGVVAVTAAGATWVHRERRVNWRGAVYTSKTPCSGSGQPPEAVKR